STRTRRSSSNAPPKTCARASSRRSPAATTTGSVSTPCYVVLAAEISCRGAEVFVSRKRPKNKRAVEAVPEEVLAEGSGPNNAEALAEAANEAFAEAEERQARAEEVV